MDEEASPVTVSALLREVGEAREAARRDPFANPALHLALRISRLLDDGALSLGEVGGLLAELGVSTWDLGMPLPYKLALGAREFPRSAFLPALIEAYRRAMPPALAVAMPLRPARPLLAALRRWGPEGSA